MAGRIWNQDLTEEQRQLWHQNSVTVRQRNNHANSFNNDRNHHNQAVTALDEPVPFPKQRLKK